MKFGGAALADGAGVRRAGQIVAEHGGERPVVVVSALLGVTRTLDRLGREAAEGAAADPAELRIRHRTVLSQLELDAELLDRHLTELSMVLRSIRHRRRLRPVERDYLLSFGERISARLVAAHLRARGVHATPVDAFDLGLASDSNHGAARPLPGTVDDLREALERVPGVPVVTGFVAADRAGNLTTLGRNGSDLSAALVGAATGAREVQFWKAVPGVMTADPALVPAARCHPRIGYADAAVYARAGAEVLHPDTLEPLVATGIPARVLDVRDPDEPGTLIADGPPLEEPLGVVVLKDPAGVTVCGAAGATRARALLEEAGIEVLAQHRRIPGPCPRFAVAETELVRAARALHAGFFERIGEPAGGSIELPGPGGALSGAEPL
jgi:aspartate kinase